MKAQFIDYLKDIGFSDIFINRIEAIHEFYRSVSPEESVSIFVTDFIKEDGSREYENVWFFSQSYVMEAKLFLIQDTFDMTPVYKRLVYWKVEKQNYDFVKATEKSRLYIKMDFDTKLAGELKASRNNCDYLKQIFQKHILANLKQ